MKKASLIAILLALLLLTACAGGETAATGAEVPEPAPSEEPTPEPTPKPTPEPTPEPTPGPLVFPDGSTHERDESSLDLSWLQHEDAAEVAELLREMPELTTVELGADNILTAEAAAESAEEEPEEELPERERLEWADIRMLQEAAPQAEFLYRFRFYGKDFTLQDEAMDLNHRQMDDEGAAVREILPCMKHCTYVDMDFCGVSNEAMAQIRDENPQMEVVWRIWFGNRDYYSVRTDAERILSSDPASTLLDENTVALKYCTKVKYLDLGHRPTLHDFSFLGYMPDLEVVVVSLSGWTDLSCLANCPHLEYLEMCCPHVKGNIDISFLKDLKELRHLNITYLGENVIGYEVLAEMPYLERLWIGRYTDIPKDFLETLPEKLPNTEINTTTYTGCVDTWRYTEGGGRAVPRYELLLKQFDYNNYDRACSAFFNDPLYEPHK